jgi:hypothetical protein
MNRIPLWSWTRDRKTGKSRFRAGALGLVWYAPEDAAWRWKALGRSGSADSLSVALAAAQTVIVTLLYSPPPEVGTTWPASEGSPEAPIDNVLPFRRQLP